MKKAIGILGVIFTIFILLASQASAAKSNAESASAFKSNGVKNVIILIGDGMGFSQLKLTKQCYGHLSMEDIPSTGFELTDSLSGEVTDSAAAGTAIATGFKTYNGMISTIKKGEIKNVTTLLELAELCNKSTGLVSTARITHATPAVFASHVEDRDMEKEISKQLIEHKVNVMFGGGKKEFDSDTLNMAKNYGYNIVYDKKGLESANGNYILGLFSDSHIPYVLDRDENTPGLLDMTKKAVDLLEKDNDGFFLMIEAGRIDHASHANDIASVVAETKEFDDVVNYCLDYARKNKDTLVIVLADHETGGLAVGTGYGNPVNEEKILNIKASTDKMAKEIKSGKDPKEVLKEYAGITLTDDEVKLINDARSSDNKYALGNTIAEIIDEKVGVGFVSHKHTGAPVPLMVYGKGSENFRGFLHHVDTSKETAKLMLFGNTNKYIKNYGVSSLKGDANGDFVINKDDAYVTLMSYVGEEVDTQNEEKLDMDNNGLIDYMDVAIIMNKAESY
ncbi:MULTISPECIES: alkaline phosphatase [Methanococcaceae]|uniref:Alkaline phosphatase n=1 Tax=Methanococcus aeolicus (strain ATCC BAA-1280 / DSM 17508 / OCM 812 / Nankai-3) TaxID=419665 RepID=A6UUF4_META3|nr:MULTISPECIES: alkaline phosphatase [Methanococcaceae]ABR56126.1 Alkaline phosphatase [Methanococcus aeolicus Nankai-3]